MQHNLHGALFDSRKKREIGYENNTIGMINQAITFRLQDNGAVIKYSHYLVL